MQAAASNGSSSMQAEAEGTAGASYRGDIVAEHGFDKAWAEATKKRSGAILAGAVSAEAIAAGRRDRSAVGGSIIKLFRMICKRSFSRGHDVQGLDGSDYVTGGVWGARGPTNPARPSARAHDFRRRLRQ